MAASHNISIDQGTTYKEEIVIKTDPLVPTSYLDLTDYSVRMMVRKDYDSSAVLISLSTANGKITVSPSVGLIRLNFLPADTSSIPFKGESLECVYDVEIEDVAGKVIRVIDGTLTISREVTR